MEEQIRKRRVKYNLPYHSTQNKGLFHRWADVPLRVEPKKTITVGLVEGEDGKMHQINPEDINFIE